MKHLSISVLFLLALPIAPVMAQSPTRYFDHCFEDGGCAQGNIIVVEGAAFPDPAGDEAYSVATVDLRKGASNRLENQLRAIPGLQQFRRSDARSANPTSQGVTLRGLGGNASSRAILLLDGVPQADPFGGWVSWPGYEAVPLIEARVRRGGGTGADGPGALAGAIELFTNNHDRGTKFGVDAGIRESLALKGSTVRPLGSGSLSVGGSYARSDGFIPIRKGQRGSADRAATYEQAGLSLRAAVPVSDAVSVQAGLRAFTDERDRGFNFSDNQNSGVDASVRLVGSSNWRWAALGYVQLRDLSTRFGGVSADRNSVNLTLDQYATPSTGLGARFEMRPPLGDKWQLRLGADWRRTIGETKENFTFTGIVPARNRRAGGRTDTVGAFGELSWDLAFGELMLTASGRIDRWNIADGFRRETNLSDGSFRENNQYANRSGWEWTGRLGAAWNPGNEAFSLRGAVYSGWRLPTLNELYRPFRVGADATAANEQLAPERLKGVEIGVEYDDDDEFDISATAFWNRLDNAIANVTLARGPGNFPGVGFVSAAGTFSRRQNLEAITSKGIEIDAAFDLTDRFDINSGYAHLILRLGYAYVDAKVEAGGVAAAVDGLRPAQVPKHFGSLSLDYDDRTGAKTGLAMRYVSRQFEDDLNSQRLKGALTLDGHVGHVFGKFDQYVAEVRVENVFDAEVPAAISSSGIIERASPRTLWLGLRWKFD